MADPRLLQVSDLPGHERVQQLNRELGEVIAHDVEQMLPHVPYSARASLLKAVLKRLVAVEGQLLTEASIEALEKRLQTRELLDALREGRLMPRLGGAPWSGRG